MRTSSSHTTQVPPDDPWQDDSQPSRPPSHFLNHDAHDPDSNSSTSSSDNVLSQYRPGPPRLVSRRPAPASFSANRTARMTATSSDGPGVPSSSRRSPTVTPSSHSQHYTQSDVDMTDSDAQESDPECAPGGAPLALVAPTRAHQATMPTPESDPEYLSDADQEESDDEDDDDDDDNQQDDHGDNGMHPMHQHLNSLPLMPPVAPVPLYGAFFFQNGSPYTHDQPQMPVQPMTLSMPAGPTDLANLPPLPQPPPNWVPLPAFIADQNLAISNPVPGILGSENFDLADFLRDWAYQGRYGHAARSQPPALEELLRQTQEQPDEIEFTQLKGDQYDLQGWALTNGWQVPLHASWQLDSNYFLLQLSHETLSSRESFYRFKRMNIRKDVCLAHFQLRSVLACPTRTHAYYPTPQGIARMNLASRKSETFMNTRDFPATGAVISTVDADCGVLMCGTFNGEYYIKSLDAPEKQAYSEGQITSDPGGITNHIKIHKPRRSCGPAAAIASNDHGFRLLDLETQKIVQEKKYPFALNCTAVSPDRRLRTVVGDHFNVLITNADTGEVLQELGGHRDYGFACDWSDDGWTVATGFQDMAVKIWDARRWCNSSGVPMPLCTVRTEMAGARSLRFSPLGSGPPVLVAAEEADFVNIIDAKMFHYKQEIDVFGEIGGVAFANDGQDLNVLCCDTHRGGLLQLQRCRGRRSFLRSYDEESMANRHSWLPDTDATPATQKIPALF
ncbi:WD domain-containing protein [Cordyceps javanica]|uniref:WD domain-containing protein n=1 Tax=Cordyceps javanica TaxID=43265 RepID=A0A545V2F9_9HYPO|nr:WD domain-containing protein [Cordyceps javanica]